HHHNLHSFPTRRSSDLSMQRNGLDTFMEATKRETRYAKSDLEAAKEEYKAAWGNTLLNPYKAKAKRQLIRQEARYKAQEEYQNSDRKSTRLNSSHVKIS